MNDKDIIRLLQERSEAALSEVERLYRSQCLRIARNILGNDADAEECFNDALLKLWNSIPPNEPQSLYAYLSVLTRNSAIDRYKYLSADKRNEFTVVYEELENCIPQYEQFDSSNALAEALNEFLASEEPVNRRIFLLRYYESSPIADISKLLKLPKASVKMRISRLRKRLKTHLEKKGVLK